MKILIDYCKENLILVLPGKRNTVKLRNGPAAVTGNIYFSLNSHWSSGRLKDKFNAGSQKTCMANRVKNLMAKGFVRIKKNPAKPFFIFAGINSEELL